MNGVRLYKLLMGKSPSNPAKRRTSKDRNQYHKGWNRQKVQTVLAHYENQTGDEAVAEDEAALRDGSFAMIQVPIDLVPRVQKLLAKRVG
jgi:hypothetical protein